MNKVYILVYQDGRVRNNRGYKNLENLVTDNPKLYFSPTENKNYILMGVNKETASLIGYVQEIEVI